LIRTKRRNRFGIAPGRTVDYVAVISGEIDLMLDDSVVHLKAGDTVVQQATNHAWVNRGKEICRLLFVVMDAKQP
jgi:uncharacterized cupin superfamily protein